MTELQIIAKLCERFSSITVWKHLDAAEQGEGDYDLSICPTELEEAVTYLTGLLSAESNESFVYKCRHAKNVVQVIKLHEQGMLQIDFSYQPSRFCYNWIDPMMIAKYSYQNGDGIKVPEQDVEIFILMILYLSTTSKKKKTDLNKITNYCRAGHLSYRKARKFFNPLISLSLAYVQFRVRVTRTEITSGVFFLRMALLVSSVFSGQIFRCIKAEKDVMCTSRKIIHYHKRKWQSSYTYEQMKAKVSTEEDVSY